MKNTIKVLANSLTLLAAIFINYLSNTGAIGKSTVGAVSNKYDTLIAPAGYAFTIWGVIYLLLIAFAGYQWYISFRKKDQEVVEQTGWWFTIANIANAVWVIFWINEYFAFSVLIMFILLFSLTRLAHRLKLELWDAPVRVIFFVWWPITIYLGWIILASVANVAAFLVSLGWNGEPLAAEFWTILMIYIATAVYLLLTFRRNMREASVVGIWGLVAIAVKQWEINPDIVIAALIAAGILFIAASYHGIKKIGSSPISKIFN